MDPRTFDADLMSEMLSAMGKELKLARAKILSLESEDYQKRAESAEYALGVMKKNFEEVCLENRRLQAALDETKDSKVWIKKEKIEDMDQDMASLSQTDRSEEAVSTDPTAADNIKDLEQALERYYQKYRTQKDAKNELRETCRELEEKLLKMEAELKEQKAFKKSIPAAKVSTAIQTPKRFIPSPTLPPVMTSLNDVHKFMANLPTVSNPYSAPKWKPVCNTSMDLKAYLADDPRFKEIGTNLLCLPGRVVRCPASKQHALAVGPRYIYSITKQTLSKNEAGFSGLYGQTFHLFYTWRESIYYAGFYKAIDLRSEAPEGISMAGSDLSWKAIAEVTLGGLTFAKTNRVFGTLYQEGLLKVEVLGLQCLECDMNIYDMLTSRFAAIQSATNPVGNFGGYFPEAMQQDSEEPKKKKHKTAS